MNKQQELLDKLVSGFSAVPQVEEIYTFGKIVSGTIDEYSDVDLVLVSRDMAGVYGHFERVIGEISPITGSYTIVSTNKKIARMYVLDDYTPFQKIDISIDQSADDIIFADKQLLYKSDGPSPSVSEMPVVLEKFSDENQLYDVLFNIPRFCKSLHRGEPAIYRRWTGIREYLEFMLYARYVTQKPYDNRKLGPHEYEAMLKNLDSGTRERLDSILPAERKVDLANSYQGMMKMLVSLFLEKIGEGAVNTAFVERMLVFMDSELAGHRDGT